MSRNALILLAHGSSDPRWAEPFEAIARQVSANRADALVRLAYLERMHPDLDEAAAVACAQGATHLVVVPLFLAQGGHVRGDLPRLVQRIKDMHPTVAVTLVPAAGEAEAVQAALAAYCVAQLPPGG